MTEFTFVLEPVDKPNQEEHLTISPIDLKTDILCIRGLEGEEHSITVPSLDLVITAESDLAAIAKLQIHLNATFKYLCGLDQYRRDKELRENGWEKIKNYNRRFVRMVKRQEFNIELKNTPNCQLSRLTNLSAGH